MHASSRLPRVPSLLPARAWLLLAHKRRRGRSRRVKGRLVMWGKKRLQGVDSGRALAAVTWRRHLSRVGGSEGIAWRLGRVNSYRAIAETDKCGPCSPWSGEERSYLGNAIRCFFSPFPFGIPGMCVALILNRPFSKAPKLSVLKRPSCFL